MPRASKHLPILGRLTSVESEAETEVLVSLSVKLSEMARTLDAREQAALDALLWSALDPIDRAAEQADGELLTQAERRILQSLELEFEESK